MTFIHTLTLKIPKMPDTCQTKHAKQSDTAVSHYAEEDSLHMWEKLSDKLLDSMNKRFDLQECEFEPLMNTQSALTERLVTVEEQGSEHERRTQMLELCLADIKKSNKRLLIKIDDLEGHSRCNNIKIVGISAESATTGELQWSSSLHLPELCCGGDGTEKRISRGNPGTKGEGGKIHLAFSS